MTSRKVLGCGALVLAILAKSYVADEQPLDAPEVVIDLYSADVDVFADPTAKPVLRAATAGEKPTPAALERTTHDGVLELRRGAGEDGRIKVDVVVGAEQTVTITGRDLRVNARESEQPGVTAPPGLRLSVEDSEVDMEGGRGAVVEARRSSLWLARARGLLSLTLESGSAEIREFDGDLELEANGAEITLIDPGGRFEPALTGGSLDVRGGSGHFEGTATDAVLLFDGWSGVFLFTGTGTTLEATGTEVTTPWKVVGQDLRLTLDQLAGPTTVELSGGSLRATSMAAAMRVTASDGTDVELEDLAEGVTLKLSSQAAARLTSVSNQLSAEVDDGRLEVDGAARLSVTGSRCEVRAGRIERLVKLETSDSELDLDLTGALSLSPVSLQGTGRAEMKLTAPCRVRIAGSQALVSERIDVTGCELRIPGQPDSSSHRRLIYGDRTPIVLTVSLGEDVDLDVEGLP